MTGDQVKNKLSRSGYQLVDISQKMDISPQSLQSKLKAKDLGIGFLLSLAKAIDKSLFYFFEDEPEYGLKIKAAVEQEMATRFNDIEKRMSSRFDNIEELMYRMLSDVKAQSLKDDIFRKLEKLDKEIKKQPK